MLVSVVVPVYNVEHYLCECLDSLRDQTLQDIEVICVDDGSTDSSLSILREYESADARFKVITKPNAGYGHTMNVGFAAASAPYVGILESDDFCVHNMLERMYSLALASDLDLVRCDLNLYWSKPIERIEPMRCTPESACGFVFNPRERKECFLLPPALCSMLIRKSLVEDNELRFLETPGASYQDTSFGFKLWACAKRVLCISDPLLFYRQDNEASSINQSGKILCVPEEYAEIERFLVSGGERQKELFPVAIARKFGAYLWNYERMSNEFHTEFAQHMADEFKDACGRLLLDSSYYSSNEWSDLMLLLKDPLRFVERMDVWSELKMRAFHASSRIARKL
ncbi:MAG: glycosyltransferase family 2 protein, partial [Raoultibacter sp.]